MEKYKIYKRLCKPFNQKFDNSNQSIFVLPKSIIKYDKYGKKSVIIKLNDKTYISMPKTFIDQSKFDNNDFLLKLSQTYTFHSYNMTPSKENKKQRKVKLTDKLGVTFQLEFQRLHEIYQKIKYETLNADNEKYLDYMKFLIEQKTKFSLSVMKFIEKNYINLGSELESELLSNNHEHYIFKDDPPNIIDNNWDWEF
ncbi:hypothetical protein [Spiroplasma endosymbiont of Labia minor]|uniref:hypothetical protein n=1 Tax=Spiroplasma endosymbiont of Labia minor TaxID=3066305 RepID=UPI0030CF11F9